MSRKRARLQMRRCIASWTAEKAWDFYVAIQQELKSIPWCLEIPYYTYNGKPYASYGDYKRWLEKYHPKLKQQWNIRKWYL